MFDKSVSKTDLSVDLPLVLKVVIEHGTSNRAHDGDANDGGTGKKCGSRIDFGCAGSGFSEISKGVWRPDLLCGVEVFEKVAEAERAQIKAGLASVCDCMQSASDKIQESRGEQPLYNYKHRDDVHGSVLRTFLGARLMRNEWNTIQVKCISRGDRTYRHKDNKNCIWMCCDKTGELCFIVRAVFGI